MKLLRIQFLTACAAASLVLAPSIFGQEAAPSPAPAPQPEVTLIPEQVPEQTKGVAPEMSEPEKSGKGDKSKTSETVEELELRIHYRQAYTKAQRDPKVIAEWDRSAKARTDLEKREALKSYYKLLHARILALDSSVKKVSDLRRGLSLRRLEQTRIDPTAPLDPQDRAGLINAAR